MKQDGKTSDMLFSIPYLIEYLSNCFQLEEGDIILTGTPSGVGPLEVNDVIQCGLETLESKTPSSSLIEMTFSCKTRSGGGIWGHNISQ